MPENLLTDAKVKAVRPTDRNWKLSDGGGLFLLVKPTGGKLWRWKYRLQGKENLFAIGSCGSKGDRVHSEVLGRTLPFSISEIEEACPGVSRDMVRLVLRAMKSEGLIESTGKGRGAKWRSINQLGDK